jgi:hypothetical protein
MKKLILPLALSLVLLTSCNGNGLQTAQRAQSAIQVALNIAAVEENLVPVQDQAIYKNFVTLGNTLNGQLGTCITNVTGIMGTGAKFASCFNTFAQGVLSPVELAQLRLLSPTTAAKVQLYVTAVVAGVNIAIAAFGGTPAATPVVGASPSTSQLNYVEHQMREAAGY